MQGKKLLQNGENILKFDLFWLLKKISPSFTASMYVGEKKTLKKDLKGTSTERSRMIYKH